MAGRALKAWPVMQGENALVLLLEADHGAQVPHLRFYEGASYKYRDLGAVALRSAALSEHKLSDGSWAFVLAGESAVAANVRVAGREKSADRRRFTDVYKRSGERKTIPLEALLGEHLDGIYEPGSPDAGYVQFQRDGTAVIEDSHSGYQTGAWRTDGETLTVVQGEKTLAWPRKALTEVSGVPAGIRLDVRLLEPLDSATAKAGDPVRAVLISPATVHHEILIPQGAEFDGHLIKAHGVG